MDQKKKKKLNGSMVLIKDMAENNQNNLKNRKVTWVVFTWSIGIIFLLFAIVFNVMAGLNHKIEKAVDDTAEIKMDVREIKTNVAWIMESIKNNK